MLRQSLERVLREYRSAKAKPLSGHPLATFLRRDLPKVLEALVENPERYKFEGSAGHGNWARCPWVAAFDILITDSAQSGYYPVYLFRRDMQGVYLSMNQGVTEVIEKYKENPGQVLKIRASDFRAQIGSLPERFSEIAIDLATTSPTELASFYESGNICGRYYRSDSLPPEDELVSDFRKMIGAYELLSYNENIPTTSQREHDEAEVSGIEDLRRLREHKRIERNRRISEAAKKIHGYTCQACGFNFEEIYGPLGKKYIEAHHLVPISQLKGQVVRTDARRDFAVLRSNCHSMIHRFDTPQDISAFRRIVAR